MEAFKRPVAPYLVPLDEGERRSYYRIRVPRGRRAVGTAGGGGRRRGVGDCAVPELPS